MHNIYLNTSSASVPGTGREETTREVLIFSDVPDPGKPLIVL